MSSPAFVSQFNAMPDSGSTTLPAVKQNSLNTMPQATKKKPKKIGGIEGFLVNSLPAIASGVGAVGGSFIAPLAGTAAGGAAGGAFGEALKRKILGENEDIGQIGTQALEGGVLSGIGGAGKGLVKGAQALTKIGTGTAEKEAADATASKVGGSFLKNLTTQGQQAQGRVSGISAGSKVAGKELMPQDTTKMLDTLKKENINTGNANNTLRDVTDKLKGYGQQIANHFKTNDAPLTKEDTNVIANNFLKSIPTTDERVLKEANVLADDLKKNVGSTKDLWDFRKTLDSRVPDSKFASDETTNKIAAIKSMRNYISSELGKVPGMENYHDLSEIKPFVSAEAKRLNNPGGGIVGRVLSSGPVQKAENALGKVTEKVGKSGSADAQAKDILENGTGSNRAEALRTIEHNQSSLTDSDRLALAGGDTGQAGLQMSSADRDALLAKQLAKSSPDALTTADKLAPQAVDTMSPESVARQNLMQKLIGAGANPIANPGKTAGAIVKQEAGRGFGIPAAIASTTADQQSNSQDSISMADNLLNTSAQTPEDTNDPFSTANVSANVQSILKQGGTMKDVSDYLSNVKDYQALVQPATSKLNATQQQQANNALSGLQDIQNLSQMLSQDPSLALKSTLPGGSITQRLTGTTDYEAAKNNIVDVIARLRSGAAISSGEEKLYNSLLPAAGDTSESANAKLQRLSTLLSSFATPTSGSGSDVTDLLANSGT